MLPGDGEDDAVQDGEHDEAGDNRDGEQSNGVLGMQHLGEGAQRVTGPSVPAEDGRQAQAENDAPDDCRTHLATDRYFVLIIITFIYIAPYIRR